LTRYVPFDVSDEFLRDAATTLSDEFAALEIHLVIGDFHQHLPEIPTDGRRMVAFLGGTIGNLNPAQRARFLFDLNCTMSSDDSLLLGTDLVKDRGRLVAAYDDATGVTADFNRNVLHVLNEQLGGDFDPMLFRHVALWNEEEQWIEMRLRADQATEVSLADAGITVRFDEGEDLLTEISAKFTPDQVEEELHEAGFVLEDTWGAEEGEFLLTLAHPLC
jgi:L-histidine N-alpha-methyltransferase